MRATVDEALAIKRNELAGAWYIFSNLSGQRSTKGGWKTTLSVLMAECVLRRRAALCVLAIQPKRMPAGWRYGEDGRGDHDTLDATLHSNKQMIRRVYLSAD